MATIIYVAREISPDLIADGDSHEFCNAEKLRALIQGALETSRDGCVKLDFSEVQSCDTDFLNKCFGGLIKNKIVLKSDFTRRVHLILGKNFSLSERIFRIIARY